MSDAHAGDAAGLEVGFFLDWIERTASAVAAEKERLTSLDAAIGDGDHGTNLDRGFTAARAALEAKPPEFPGAALVQVGTTLISSVGGASGPLYGTVFRRTGKALGEAESVSARELADAIAAGLAGVQKLGGASVGDKTMVDVFVPALDALLAGLADGASVDGAFGAAADVAESAARSTIPLRARKGRASYLGERSEGHEDPGAASAALLWRALAESVGGRAR
ncbi:dihydroxyacetone kinase subunit DhaL [Actinospica acidithermotolerans]|uniref:dihydroxyacetone kinase subunit DhaL n=1 Tax=Actinospica acidithermotolerans TaxID=2828514 RepID=UPI0027DCB405|nr:dihydroxyacetone kinase subunit DhaL [Actinospica acidithermotolerans]